MQTISYLPCKREICASSGFWSRSDHVITNNAYCAAAIGRYPRAGWLVGSRCVRHCVFDVRRYVSHTCAHIACFRVFSARTTITILCRFWGPGLGLGSVHIYCALVRAWQTVPLCVAESVLARARGFSAARTLCFVHSQRCTHVSTRLERRCVNNVAARDVVVVNVSVPR